MKRNFNNISLASAILAVITFLGMGCKKSFLEIPSKTALSTPIYFKTQNDFQNAVNGAYVPLRGLYGMSFLMGELRSDNTTFNMNPNNRSYYPFEYVDTFLDDATDDVISGKYTANYSIIARVNQVLDQIDAVKFDSEPAKQQMKGEVYFLRALAYFDLAQYYGAVPLHLKPATTLNETALPLTKVDSIYLQVISDASLAASLLPDKAKQTPGRATSGAAYTLLGNVYMVLKKWPDAEAALKKVTGYSLISNYSAVYDPANKNNAESIFEVQYMQGIDGYASNFFYQFVPQPITAAELTAVTGIVESDQSGESLNVPTPDMIAVYETGDLRKAASIGTITANGKTYPYIKKYLHAHALAGNTDDNWPVYRYAEVLLFLAETLNEQGKPADALTYLNEVRNRAGLGNYSITDQETLRRAIQSERRVELAFENKRWPDLVRTGKAVDVMTAQGVKIRANPQAYYYPAGYTLPPNAFKVIPLTFPIPSSEASLNPYF